eukprot:GHRQ01007556.1.p1 GENE.GHRQ01007556.1~~GHRQ01007556.1.p1  ORF type:complete len:382 (+),score=151.12 GHRQ01007556.1:1-1146(+)
MPSELLLSGRMTTATDIYSFGLMMWELLTSQPVFEEGMSIGQMFYMIAYQNWRPTVPADCPPGYAHLMKACWNQDPEQRPKVQQLLRSLQKLYVAEKQRIVAAKTAVGSSQRSSMESARPAGQSPRPAAATPAPTPAPAAALAATAAATAAAAAAVRPPVHSTAAAPAPATQPSAAADWARAAAVAASARAAFGNEVTQQWQGHQEQRGQKTPDRTSFESTGSDRYQNAASAASEPSLLVGGLPPWDYPGQLSQVPATADAAAAAVPVAAAAKPSLATDGNDNSSTPLRGSPAAAAAAAPALAHRCCCHARAVHCQPQEPVQGPQCHAPLQCDSRPQVRRKPHHVLQCRHPAAATAAAAAGACRRQRQALLGFHFLALFAY